MSDLRHIPLSGLKMRVVSAEGEPTTLGGHATVFGEPYSIGSDKYETIEQGAFRSAFETRGHTKLPVFYQHGWARGGVTTPVGMAVMDDSGEKMELRSVLYTDESEEARVLERAAQDGTIAEWSLGFVATDEETDPEHPTVTRVREADPLEVSIVLRGAADTKMTVRSTTWDEIATREAALQEQEQEEQETEEEVVSEEETTSESEDVTVDLEALGSESVRAFLESIQE